MDVIFFILISHLLFLMGLVGLLKSRNPLIVFLSVELMLNSANLLFVAFSRQQANEEGLIWVFFVLIVAACEAAVGLSIVTHLFRTRRTVDIDSYHLLQG